MPGCWALNGLSSGISLPEFDPHHDGLTATLWADLATEVRESCDTYQHLTDKHVNMQISFPILLVFKIPQTDHRAIFENTFRSRAHVCRDPTSEKPKCHVKQMLDQNSGTTNNGMSQKQDESKTGCKWLRDFCFYILHVSTIMAIYI